MDWAGVYTPELQRKCNLFAMPNRGVEPLHVYVYTCHQIRMDWVGGLKSKISLFVGYEEIDSTHD